MRPENCPLAASNTGKCRISWAGWRQRKCGPGYPLARVSCATHGGTSTIYPLGWSCFGRRANAVVSPAGLDLEKYEAGTDAWIDTSFGASADASAGRKWPSSGAEIGAWSKRYARLPYGVARTQYRHIAGVSALFALTPDLAERLPTVVAAIHINLSDLVVAAGRVRDGPRFMAEGEKGAAVLRILGAPRRHLLRGINRLGTDRKYWGPPIRTLTNNR